MNVKAGEWIKKEPVERYLEIHRAYVRTQLKNQKEAS